MRFIVILLMGFMSSTAWAADSVNVAPATAKQIRENIPSLPIDAIRPSNISGLYELQVGNQIFYAGRTGKYLIAGGHIIDIASRTDLTAKRLEEINSIDWSSLPLNQAIVSGDPDGLPVAIFTDPECPYCKTLEISLKGATDIKIYTFLFPLESIHPNAKAKSESIWCAENQHEALLQVMLENKTLAKATCDTPIAANIALARKLGISGTPTLISGDGRKRSGSSNAAQLKAWLENK
ncbi:MAG: protein-disulfide isomerase [Proteobacteria bacterium]|nr:MAG: protein-disulfide isomerase [Pseudomonadota bacterium]